MITDIFGMTNYKKNEKEILELVSKEICEQLSEELNKKIDSIVIHVDVDRRYVRYSPPSSFMINSMEIFKVDVMSGSHLETIEGKAAESIYRRYLELVGKYALQFKNRLPVKAYYKLNSWRTPWYDTRRNYKRSDGLRTNWTLRLLQRNLR